jgi:REP element-mobilizing transposase RayT
MNPFHQRHLPHFQPADGTFFSTFRLADSLPVEVVNRLREGNISKHKLIAGMLDKREQRLAWQALQSDYFRIFEEALDHASYGPKWLSRADIAQTVMDTVAYAATTMFHLHALTVMPNHVHLAFSLGEGLLDRPRNNSQRDFEQLPHPASRILGSIKKFSARKANQVLGRHGPFWQDESYDRLVRDVREFRNVLWYIIQNPVRAGLVKEWRQWPWTICDETLEYL